MYLKEISAAPIPQSEPLDNRQVKNSAGGFSFAVDEWTKLDRFLILGSEGGSYYASERDLTFQSLQVVDNCLALNGRKVVERIVEISDTGRAPKNEPALFALAKAASYKRSTNPFRKAPDLELEAAAIRKAALDALPQVARTGTHLLHFASFLDDMRGWGPAVRRAVGEWFTDRKPDDLVYQAMKYRQRDGWSLRDLLRLSHPVAEAPNSEILRWIVKGWESIGEDPHPDEVLARIWAFEKLQKTTDPATAASLIRAYRLPRETVPTELLKEAYVWEALLVDMNIGALIRNLPTLTRVGLLDDGKVRSGVVAQLTNHTLMQRARIHPINVLTAQLTYASGHSLRGDTRWTPKPQIIDALNDAFYLAFPGVEPTGKRFLLGVDVSGSMGTGFINGVPNFSPRVAAAAMSLVTAATEQDYQIMGFTDTLVPLNISARSRLDDVQRTLNRYDFGRTDCALPMVYALQHKIPVDAFVIYTDNETWAGSVHPVKALKDYRQKMGIPAKLIVQAFVANEFSIADPDDAGMMDIAGLDSAAPSIMADFIRQDNSSL